MPRPGTGTCPRCLSWALRSHRSAGCPAPMEASPTSGCATQPNSRRGTRRPQPLDTAGSPQRRPRPCTHPLSKRTWRSHDCPVSDGACRKLAGLWRARSTKGRCQTMMPAYRWIWQCTVPGPQALCWVGPLRSSPLVSPARGVRFRQRARLVALRSVHATHLCGGTGSRAGRPSTWSNSCRETDREPPTFLGRSMWPAAPARAYQVYARSSRWRAPSQRSDCARVSSHRAPMSHTSRH
mmetsp:Transcript_10986/g.26146  ORF Transcript_10986/g.26146 Transcript_10986/m.26146 type:complete len:238 (-) Transcript_10986:512-1225(-)